MSQKLMSVVVQGRDKTYSFLTYQDPRHLPEYLEQGLDVQVVENIIPDYKFLVCSRLSIRIWCFLQDVWNLKNPLKFYKESSHEDKINQEKEKT